MLLRVGVLPQLWGMLLRVLVLPQGCPKSYFLCLGSRAFLPLLRRELFAQVRCEQNYS